MVSAVFPSWDSTLVAPAASSSPSFALSEVPVSDDDLVITDEGLQFVASFLQQSGQAGDVLDAFDSVEKLPLDDQLLSIDASLLDFVEVPDLEDVVNDAARSTAPLSYNQLFDEIPALEDVPVDEVNWPSWTNDEVTIPSKVVPPNSPSSPSEDERRDLETVPRLRLTLPPSAESVPVDEDDVTVYEEEVKSTEVPGYLEVGLASPLSVYSAADSTTSCGVGGSCSSRFTTLEDLSPCSDKKRRVSQASVSSSFYSCLGSPVSSSGSSGSSLGSPVSSSGSSGSSSGLASDSDVSEGPSRVKVGRRSRYSPEDRKERKKAQNRSAAERYRLKRRQAEEIISEEEQQLIDANSELRTEVTKLEAEVSCMKRLMREMLRAKGIDISAAPLAKKSKIID